MNSGRIIGDVDVQGIVRASRFVGDGSILIFEASWTNPVHFGPLRVWTDTSTGRMRYKYNADPANETDGTLI